MNKDMLKLADAAELTDREELIIKAIYGIGKSGKTLKVVQIAEVLGISPSTVSKMHRMAIAKLKRAAENSGVLEAKTIQFASMLTEEANSVNADIARRLLS